MNKVTVICEKEHDITPGVCALCERDTYLKEVHAWQQAVMEKTNLWTSIAARANEILGL